MEAGLVEESEKKSKEEEVNKNELNEKSIKAANERNSLRANRPAGNASTSTRRLFQFKKRGTLGRQNCPQLFHPCTREPLENVEALERIIRDIKANVHQEETHTKQLPSDIKSRLDLLLYILNREEPPGPELLSFSSYGQLYEAYWDIVFALGNILPGYERNEHFYLVNKKAEEIRNIDEPEFIQDPIQYLESRGWNMGASGASDITFCYKTKKETMENDPCSADKQSGEGCKVGEENAPLQRPKFYFCSSKYYRQDSKKGVEKYDIQKIYTAAKNLHIEYDINIILLVKDKSIVDSKLKRAISKYISEEASAVFGEKDLFAALKKFYDLVRAKLTVINKDTIKQFLGLSDIIRPILLPRLHQNIAILKIKKAIQNFKTGRLTTNKFLVGLVPRGGKTYIAGGIVTALQPKRVVVLLGAKSETISQFTAQLFEHYQDFIDYTVIDVVESMTDFTIDSSKKYIFVMSVELFKMENSRRKLLIDLRGGETPADLFICDEAHLKQTTAKSIKALEEGTVDKASDAEESAQLGEIDQQISKTVPVVYMTGTYIKPLTVFKIPDENVILWEYQDIQKGKYLSENEEYFKEMFGDIYTEALQKSFSYGETYESIQQMYRKFPELYLLSTQFSEDAKSAFLAQEMEKGGWPTISHLFQIKKDFDPATVSPNLWSNGFTNPKGMSRLINYLSPSNNIKEDDVTKIGSVMKRIDRIAQRIGDRLAFFTTDFVVHSQLWFLPMMKDHPLIKRMAALAATIFKSDWYRNNFIVLAVSSSQDWSKIPGTKHSSIKIQTSEEDYGIFSWACPRSGETLKDCILRFEAEARKKGKGLIILAQNMLHLGISLSCVDIVVLLDAGEKVDERIQKMYRALTESINKKGGYIVDMNYFRTVTAIMNYQIQSSRSRLKKNPVKETLGEEFNAVLETFSIDDDLDIYETREEGGKSRIERETIPELQRQLEAPATKRGDSMGLSNAGQALNANIDAVVAKDYDKGFDKLLGEIGENVAKKLLRKEGNGIAEAEEDDSAKDGEDREPKAPAKLFPDEVNMNPAQKKLAFIDIFKTTLKIGIFGTAYTNVPELIEGLRSDDELFETVFDTLIKRGAIHDNADKDFLRGVILHELEKMVTNTRVGSYHTMKEVVNSKDTRDSKFQEVLNYINEHLAPKDKERHKYGEVFTPLSLVDEMLSKLPEEVWSNKNLKWLDPANGIGNFPIKAFIGQSEGEFKYPGLFEGLSGKIKDEKERCKWIIENMLYMIDINGKNNLVAKRLFEKICPGAKANIEQIDKKNGFLADKPLKFNGVEVDKFDIIMGNPPFNRGAVRVAMVTSKTRKERKELGIEQDDAESGYWYKFVKRALVNNLLSKGGYLLFIHPITWFKPDKAGAHDLILNHQLLNIRIYTDAVSKKIFGGKGEISVAYYLLENTEPKQKTEIINMNGGLERVKLNNKSIIIKQGNSIFQKIQNKVTLFGEGESLLHRTIKSCDDKGTHKLITILEDVGKIKYVMSSTSHPDQNKPKVIVGGVPKPIVLYDKKGEYGIYSKGQRHYFIGDDLDKINDYFKTKLSTYILKYVKFEQKFIKPAYYPDIRDIPVSSINDKTLADYFEFDENEKKEISEMPEPLHPSGSDIVRLSCAELKGEKEQEGGSEDAPRNKTRKIHRD